MNKEKLKELLDSPELVKLLMKMTDGISEEKVKCFMERQRKELEEPTYKTEDGYEVKEADIVYGIDKNKIYPHAIINNETVPNKMFYEKENAENYLIENAEVLSYSESKCFAKEYEMKVNLLSWGEYLKQKIRQKLGL